MRQPGGGRTLVVLLLLTTGRLRIGHLYALNAVGGLMNAFQQPASDVAVSLLAPKEPIPAGGGRCSPSPIPW